MICEFEIRAECEALDETYYRDGSVILDMTDLKTIIPYLYEKHFGKPYKELGWWLEPGAKEFVKEIEDKWMHNQLEIEDDDEYVNSYFENHKYEIIDKYAEDIAEEIEEDLSCLGNSELKYLDDEYIGSISFELYLNDQFIDDYEVDIPYYDEDDLEEDEEEEDF